MTQEEEKDIFALGTVQAFVDVRSIKGNVKFFSHPRRQSQFYHFVTHLPQIPSIRFLPIFVSFPGTPTFISLYISGSQPFLVGGTLHIQINLAAHL